MYLGHFPCLIFIKVLSTIHPTPNKLSIVIQPRKISLIDTFQQGHAVSDKLSSILVASVADTGIRQSVHRFPITYRILIFDFCPLSFVRHKVIYWYLFTKLSMIIRFAKSDVNL